MKYGIIYKITNTVTGKVYVGQTTSPIKLRWKMHKAASRNNRSNSALHSSIAKHGIENFLVEEISTCFDKVELDLREQYFIDLFCSFVPSGYNLKTGGANGKHSIESKEKMSVTRKKLVADQQYKDKITKNITDYKNSITEEEWRLQSSMNSKEYWAKPGVKEAKSADIKCKWENLPKKDKQHRTKGFREYWTEEKLNEHSEKIKDMELWKKSGCLDKAMEKVSKPVKVVNLSSGKATLYRSNAAVCRELKMTAGTLIDILKGKRSNEYKGYRFISVN